MKRRAGGRNVEPSALDVDSIVIGKRGERAVREKVGGRKTPGSGNKNIKGDVWTDYKRMIESKATSGHSIRITIEMLEKLSNDAWIAGREPVLVLTFQALEVGSKMWGCVPMDRLEELYKAERTLADLHRMELMEDGT